MIGKHLWPKPGGWWHSKETRTCLKCGAVVMLVCVPRGGSRVFRTKKLHLDAVFGLMQPCNPPEQHAPKRWPGVVFSEPSFIDGRVV